MNNRAQRPISVFLLFCFSVFYSLATRAQEKPMEPGMERAQVEKPAMQMSSAINLPIEKIPMVNEPLPVLKLEAQPIPREFLTQVLKTSAPTVKELAPLSKNPDLIRQGANLPAEILGAFENGHLAVYADQQTGNLEVFPSLQRQKGVPLERFQGNLKQRAQTLANQVFTRADFLAKDDTQWRLTDPMPMLGLTQNREEGAAGNNKAPSVYLTFVSARRTVQGYPVYGTGSRALVAVGTDGSQQGLLRYWKSAKTQSTVKEMRSREEVQGEILRQLEPVQHGGQVEVQNVEVGYYDGNANYIQPVYRFTARIHHEAMPQAGVNRGPVADDDFVAGYVPIGNPLETIPTLGEAPSGPQPENAPERLRKVMASPGDPTVGRYVVRNDDPGWVNDANGFWSALNPWFGSGRFTNSQYYWAEPFEFNTAEKSFVNSVNVALNEVHGNWWFFTTYQNWGDGVDITAIPASQGYGPAAGGQLDFWILHSCEVVPSAADAPCSTDSRSWWTPWFNVFQGLHSVVGYRTIMYINDSAGTPFGWDLWVGIPVVSAWFNAVQSLPDYFGNPTATAHCGTSLPMGRPSTVSVCGHEDDNIYNTSSIPAAGCLVNYWIPN